MLVSITGVKVESVKSYKKATVGYLRDGKDSVQNILSFLNPKVFEQVIGIKDFPVDVNVEMIKNAKGYWEWKSVEFGGQGNDNRSTQPPTRGKVTGSNYETPEERARRQVYIVRQSSISSAIQLAEISSKAKPEVEEILQVAKRFENYVMDTGIEGLTDDIPE